MRSETQAAGRVMFAAPASGSGKTTITCGLLHLLKQRGISCASFKCGPDYIDSMFHRYVLGIAGCNLDSYFLEEEQILTLFQERSRNARLAVLEGVMGYYDGVAGTQLQASSYDIARITDTPVILIVDGKKSSLSIAALVKGFLEYQPDSRIKGVILNRTSRVMAERLTPFLEEQGVRVLGAVPDCEAIQLSSRHLGLTLPKEQKRLREQMDTLAGLLKQYVDVDGILSLADSASAQYRQKDGRKENRRLPGLFRMAVARDEAFCFYYEENLEFLKTAGCELIPFSPLHEESLPPGLDGILLGGGYPELYAKELSENHKMKAAIKNAFHSGVKIMAECGGFLYLHQNLEGMDKISYPMAGLIEGDGFRTEKLSRFGYMELSDSRGRIRAHEFHYWDSTAPGDGMRAQKPSTSRGWNCMHIDRNMMAGFPHLYYLSSPEWILGFLGAGGEEP